MKSIATVILSVLTAILIIIGVGAATIRFQVLSPNFWETTLQKNDTYSNLSGVLKKAVEDQITSEGGRVGDAKILTDLITPVNLKEIIDRNLINILGYANGTLTQFNLFVPISRIPKGLLPRNISNLPDTEPVDTVLKEFNVTFVSAGQVHSISIIGKIVNNVLVLDIALIFIFLIFLFLLGKTGKNFIGAGIAFIISGIVTLGFYQGGMLAGSGIALNFSQKTNPGEVLLGVLTPPLLTEIAQTWLVAGVVLIIIGIILFLVKKPVYNISR